MSKKAIIIDDAYARPTSADIQRCVSTLRAFLTDDGKTKAWFDKEFGLSGDHKRRNYFDPLINDAEKIRHLWEKRNKSPSKMALPQTVFANIEAELAPHHAPLHEIEELLRERGWKFQKFSTLPPIQSVSKTVSVVVIDYLLSNETPSNITEKISESTAFLRELVERAQKDVAAKYPFVVLISSLEGIAKKNASEFRSAVKIPGGLFRFVKKPSISQDFAPVIDTFSSQEMELHSFRSVHESLQQAIELATKNLKSHIDEMELEDFATLHAGQLFTEKEPLSDYFGWLCGQVVSAIVQKNVDLAEKTRALPDESYQVLLGHICPTQNISKLFSSFSVIKAASGELHKKSKGERQIRFGDLFVTQSKLDSGKDIKSTDKTLVKSVGKSIKPAVIETTTYFLAISQTCDLLQNKITNGQVLCIQGTGKEIKNSEVDLLRATIHQMDGKGDILEKENGRYIQIKWNPKNLMTISYKELANETRHQYLGRLNEIYALQAQHSALQDIGRIGVPITPGYRIFFSKIQFRVFDGKSEIPELSASLDQSTILGVLRNEKSGSKLKQRLLFSGELRQWLITHIASLVNHAKLPKKLTSTVTDMQSWLTNSPEFSLLITVKDEGIGSIQREETSDPTPGSSEEIKTSAKALPGTLEILLNNLILADQTKTNQRIQIEFICAI